ncbi:Protein-glutamate methylesterase/protein-glutamine glutaminase [subsurface metagenome]
MKVFIVDSSAIVRDRLAAMFSEFNGIEFVGFAEDVSGAITLIQKKKPDIVILDIHLNKGNGIDVLKEIKKQGLPVVTIIYANSLNSQYRKACFKEGAHFVFDKSTEFETILQTIKQLNQRLQYQHCDID